MNMSDINVLVTGAGAPGIMGTIYSLKKNWDNRRIRIVGVDMNPNAVGKYFCDEFYRVPEGTSQSFPLALLDICKKEKIDVVLPQVTEELLLLSKWKKEFETEGIAIAISDEKSIVLANNKYELMRISKKLGIPTPKFMIVKSKNELLEAFEEFGEKFVIKPPVSSGMRGFRIVCDKSLSKDAFYNQKPETATITRNELLKILGEEFPPLLVMEFLPGKEYTVDVLSDKEKCYAVVPRSRDIIRSGITFAGTVIKREDLISYAIKLTQRIGLEFAHGYQFKEDESGIPNIIESNPRIQGTMVLSTFANANLIYGSVKLALGEELPEFNAKWGAKLMRYWGAIGIVNGEVEKV